MTSVRGPQTRFNDIALPEGFGARGLLGGPGGRSK